MPDQYQTPPKPSQLSAGASLGSYAVELDVESPSIDKDYDIQGLIGFQRAANYIAAAQIFLQSNGLLKRELTHDDVKPRLLGHWGTCAGLTLVYAHGSNLITRHAASGDDIQMLYVTGPGHGAPSLLSTLFIEVRDSIRVTTTVCKSASNHSAAILITVGNNDSVLLWVPAHRSWSRKVHQGFLVARYEFVI